MKDTITYEDFAKLDLRVGRIIEASAPEWSQKLLAFKVDFGPEIGQKTILSGIKKWYQPEEFIGQLYPFVINLAERKMGNPSAGSGQGEISQGMMIMADSDERPTVFPLPTEILPGTVIC